MNFVVNQPDPSSNSFFENFDSLWSRPNQAQGFLSYVLGLVCPLHRKNIEAMSTKIVGQEYQRLQHFLSGAPCSLPAANPDVSGSAVTAMRRFC